MSQSEFEAAVKAFQEHSKEIQALEAEIASLQSLKAENEMVGYELGQSKGSERLFKLVDKVLMPTNLEEAKEHVAARLDLLESQCASLTKKKTSKTQELEAEKIELTQKSKALSGAKQPA